jgi:hypothetical protein
MKELTEQGKLALKELEPLFERAEKEKLWFYSSYQGLWFSPKELKEEHENGKFIWGAGNWQLLDPQTEIDSMLRRIENTKKEIELFKKRI